ncbi:polyprenyl synthetase family protein [Candidatus Nitronereus thalassa]|uniref:Polyprenyl synthetase family protein n=1 Tax=Candidatus Nitronereus thalassa TaxID=3020898 RepID=A0ABU3KDM1_9BACT|nr:polyprenyl synthetase family protein [Candidatus Nitronereus thalassa]MDT7044202.1 polyprenyl synthetase family protein [Candidatus Nitronereus thalassa]
MANGPPQVVSTSLSMEDVFEAYRNDLEEIEAHIRQNLDSEAPLINEIAAHILSSGGKRIRPLLLSLCARLNGYDPKEDLVLGSLIEFIHTATLLHDDVLDEADLRRGQQTARRIWGNHASILVGDYLYSRAMQQIAAFQNHEVNDVMAIACRKMAEGEILQLCATRQPLLTETDYLRIVEYKTGALVASACKVGAIIGGTSPAQQKGLYQFGLYLGIAFQLADDLLDYTANGDNLGKALGQDLMQGMITLPLLHLLRSCSVEERQDLVQKIESKSIEEKDLLKITTMMARYGSLEYTTRRSQEYIDAALLNLAPFEDSSAKRALTVVADYMVNRDR